MRFRSNPLWNHALSTISSSKTFAGLREVLPAPFEDVFANGVTRAIAGIPQRVLGSDIEDLNEQVATLPGKLAYDASVCMSTGNLIHCLDRVASIQRLAESPPSDEYLCSVEMSCLDWLISQTMAHILAATTLFDSALKLVSSALHLGLAPRHCRYDIIHDNAHFRYSDVGPTLAALKAHIDEYQRVRNQFAHGGTLSSDVALLAGWLRNLQEANPDEPDDTELVRPLADEAVKTLRRFIAEHTARLISQTEELLDALLTVYRGLSGDKEMGNTASAAIGDDDPCRH